MSQLSRQQLTQNAAMTKLATVFQSLNHAIDRERVHKRRDTHVEARWVPEAGATKRWLRQFTWQRFGTVFADVIVSWEIRFTSRAQVQMFLSRLTA